MFKIDQDYLLDFSKKVLNIDSPSSYTSNVISFLKNEVNKLGYSAYVTRSGSLAVEVEGEDNSHVTGFCAHVDTLGLMVRSIKDKGTLAITKIGGPILATLDGEYCRVYTRDNKVYTGTILSVSPSAHVFKDARNLEREEDTMEIRLDEVVYSKSEVEKLGIQNGDIIAIEPKYTLTDSGFIKSRFLDDKISSSALMTVLKYYKDNNIKPRNSLKILFSTFEEVGHGSSYIPEDIEELIAVDMGCVGLDLSCSEQDVSICAKDSSGPYNYEITSRLIELAKTNNLRYAIDIYPQYSSDVSAALKGGNNIKGALIGPGVAASHGMERTHLDGVINTIKLILLYTLD